MIYHRSESKTSGRLAMSLVGLCLVGACAHREPVPPPAAGASARPRAVSLDEGEPYFVAGEQMTWNLTFLGLEGGRARLAVGEPGELDGRKVIAVVAEAEASGIVAILESAQKARDSVSSWVDLASGLPARTETDTEFKGHRFRVEAARPSGEHANLEIWGDAGSETRRAMRLPPRTHDTISALLLLRSWAAPTGARVDVFTLGGVRLWRTSLHVVGREALDTPLGHRETVRIDAVSVRLTPSFAVEPKMPARTFTIWFSEDEDRVPLRMDFKTEFGDIGLEATSYRAP